MTEKVTLEGFFPWLKAQILKLDFMGLNLSPTAKLCDFGQYTKSSWAFIPPVTETVLQQSLPFSGRDCLDAYRFVSVGHRDCAVSSCYN